MPETKDHDAKQIPCCPTLAKADACESLDLRYRLPVRTGQATVEVLLHFRLTRCAGPMALGDLAYTTTLLPGEKVRLFTSDRHSRFTFDTESKLAYRHQTTSEESYFAAGMAASMSDLSIFESSARASTFHSSSLAGGGGAGIDLGFLEIGGSVSGSSYDAQSLETFARGLSQHAQSSSRHVEASTRAQSSVAVGEVQSRTHTQGESEDSFESSSRTFENRNRCHAVTYFFYRLDKIQKVSFELVAIERRVDDPAAPTGVRLNGPDLTAKVTAVAAPVLGTAKGRLEAERADRTSRAEAQGQVLGVAGLRAGAVAAAVRVVEPLPLKLRQEALAKVDAELQERGLLDKQGKPTDRIKAELSWERTILLPTPGIVVRGCVDDCDTCEPARKREIELELKHKELQNQLLARQIELLDKAQEYRCCPAGECGEEAPAAPTP